MALAGSIKIGIALPQSFVSGTVDMDLVYRFATRAEELGYYDLWTQEQLTGIASTLEPLELMGYVSAITSRIRLGVSVVVLPLHNPLQLAKRVGTLDHMSDGRVTLGVGLGTPGPAYSGSGIAADHRVGRFMEQLRVMKALWTEPQAGFQGRFYQLDQVPMEPKPVQQPHPPVWFGARQEPGLRRAVRHGDGWMGAGSSPTEDFKRHSEQVRRFLEESGRDPSSFGLSKRVYIAIDDNAARAESRLKEWFGVFYRNADLATRVSIWGSPSHCAERLEELVEHGARHLLLNYAFDELDHLEALAELTGLKSQEV